MVSGFNAVADPCIWSITNVGARVRVPTKFFYKDYLGILPLFDRTTEDRKGDRGRQRHQIENWLRVRINPELLPKTKPLVHGVLVNISCCFSSDSDHY